MSESKHTYEVASDGRVFSLTNWRGMGRRELRQHLNDDGYPCVCLIVSGKRRRFTVHGLVAHEHLPPRPSPQHEVRHLDGNKLNPAASNLAWGTRKENAEDRERHGRTSRGAAHSAAIRSSAHSLRVKRGADHYETIAKSSGAAR